MFLLLSPDSEANYYKIAEGKDVYGKSIFRQCVSIPLSDMPRELLHVVHGNYTIILLWYCSFLGMGHIASQNHRFSFLNLFLVILIFSSKSFVGQQGLATETRLRSWVQNTKSGCIDRRININEEGNFTE